MDRGDVECKLDEVKTRGREVEQWMSLMEARLVHPKIDNLGTEEGDSQALAYFQDLQNDLLQHQRAVAQFQRLCRDLPIYTETSGKSIAIMQGKTTQRWNRILDLIIALEENLISQLTVNKKVAVPGKRLAYLIGYWKKLDKPMETQGFSISQFPTWNMESEIQSLNNEFDKKFNPFRNQTTQPAVINGQTENSSSRSNGFQPVFNSHPTSQYPMSQQVNGATHTTLYHPTNQVGQGTLSQQPQQIQHKTQQQPNYQQSSQQTNGWNLQQLQGQHSDERWQFVPINHPSVPITSQQQKVPASNCKPSISFSATEYLIQCTHCSEILRIPFNEFPAKSLPNKNQEQNRITEVATTLMSQRGVQQPTVNVVKSVEKPVKNSPRSKKEFLETIKSRHRSVKDLFDEIDSETRIHDKTLVDNITRDVRYMIKNEQNAEETPRKRTEADLLEDIISQYSSRSVKGSKTKEECEKLPKVEENAREEPQSLSNNALHIEIPDTKREDVFNQVKAELETQDYKEFVHVASEQTPSLFSEYQPVPGFISPITQPSESQVSTISTGKPAFEIVQSEPRFVLDSLRSDEPYVSSVRRNPRIVAEQMIARNEEELEIISGNIDQ